MRNMFSENHSLPWLTLIKENTVIHEHKFSDKQVWANSADPDHVLIRLFSTIIAYCLCIYMVYSAIFCYLD